MSSIPDPLNSPLSTLNSRLTHDAHDLVILCDRSGSMSHRDGARPARSEILARTLTALLPTLRGATVVAFDDEAEIVSDVTQIHRAMQPRGGTHLATALRCTRAMNPCRIVLITDGEPSDPEERSLEIVRGSVARVDAYYCGEPGNAEAIAFLRALVSANGRRGQLILDPLAKGMLEGVTLLLTAPIAPQPAAIEAS